MMNRFWYARTTQIGIFLLCLWPLADLLWRWRTQSLGINSIETVARATGNWTLLFLLFSLSVTPLRRIPGCNGLIRYRRMLGLYAFFYGVLHALHYFWIDLQWDMAILAEDFTFRRFFIAGLISLSLMVPLAATSTQAAIRWMGGKKWQRLHRLAYLSATAGVIHFFWQGKAALWTPIYYGGVLGVLMSFRVGLWIWKARK